MTIKLLRSAQIVWEELDGQALLVNPEKGERWTLNAAALEVWKRCDGNRSFRAITQTVSDLSGRGINECREELLNFAHALSAHGLLQFADGSGELTQPATAHFSVGSILKAGMSGKSVGGSHRRPSPRGNSGPS